MLGCRRSKNTLLLPNFSRCWFMKYLFLENGLVQKLPFTTLKKDSRYFTFIYFSLLHQEVIDKKYFSSSKNMKSNDFYKGCGFYIKAEKAWIVRYDLKQKYSSEHIALVYEWKALKRVFFSYNTSRRVIKNSSLRGFVPV